jgi:transposase
VSTSEEVDTMEESNPKLRVVRRDRGGRCCYDPDGKRALIEACLLSGASVARLALENGVNANLLRKWIARYLLERERAAASGTTTGYSAAPQAVGAPTMDAMPVAAMPRAAQSAPAPFVPVVAASPPPAEALSVPSAAPCVTLSLHVRLPNGVQFDVEHTSLETLSGVVHMLQRLPCSGSTPR